MRSAKIRWCVCLLAVALLIAWGQSQALATSYSYNVQHNFWWWPAAGQVPVGTLVNWKHFEHAAAIDVAVPGWAWQVKPGGQPAAFNPLWYDWMDNAGRVWNGDSGVPVLATEAVVNVFNVPPFGGTSTATAPMGGATATANSQWGINGWAAGLWGFNKAWGTASSTTGTSYAYAFSESKLQVAELTSNLRTGRFQWQPVWRDTASGSAYAHDPLTITESDSMGNTLLEDTPIHIEGALLEGMSDSSTLGWEYGRLFANGVISGEFHATVKSSYIFSTQQGTADLVIDDGLITQSNGTGIFAGLLPPIGMPGTFNVSFPSLLDVNYTYPDLGPNMTLEFGGGGGGGAVPEPGTVVLLVTAGLGLLAYAWRRRRQAT